MFRTVTTYLCVAWACIAASSIGAAAAESVATELARIALTTADDRELRGVVDARSDAADLWLRIEEGPVVLRVPVKWHNITAVFVDGRPLHVDDLKSRYADLATPGPQNLVPEVLVAQLPTVSLPTRRSALGAAPHVCSLGIVGATLVNLDRDVEPDGIAVTLALVGEGHLPISIRGSLRATLYGERRSSYQPDVEFPTLEEWVERICVDDFCDGVATITLPFRRMVPEWAFDLLPDAIINVEVGVFGQGTFAASAPVVIRPFNPVRDDRQLRRGSRFFPGELHQDPVDNRFEPRAGRWFHWTW